MELLSVLRVGLSVAALYAVIALAYMAFGVISRGGKRAHSQPAGSEPEGIKYAFFRGMLPTEKESVRNHLPTFAAGLMYHASIFVGGILILLAFFQVKVSPALVLTLRMVLIAGLVSGVALLVKRWSSPQLRIISAPDDFISNALVDLFLMASIAVTMSSVFVPMLFEVSIVLFLYIPVGKIRHCVFFFFTRVNFGRLFGRRGVFPHRTPVVPHGGDK